MQKSDSLFIFFYSYIWIPFLFFFFSLVFSFVYFSHFFFGIFLFLVFPYFWHPNHVVFWIYLSILRNFTSTQCLSSLPTWLSFIIHSLIVVWSFTFVIYITDITFIYKVNSLTFYLSSPHSLGFFLHTHTHTHIYIYVCVCVCVMFST